MDMHVKHRNHGVLTGVVPLGMTLCIMCLEPFNTDEFLTIGAACLSHPLVPHVGHMPVCTKPLCEREAMAYAESRFSSHPGGVCIISRSVVPGSNDAVMLFQTAWMMLSTRILFDGGRVCEHCHRPDYRLVGTDGKPLQRNKLTCTGCHRATYCNAKCQQDDWANHKAACRAISALKEDARAPRNNGRVTDQKVAHWMVTHLRDAKSPETHTAAARFALDRRCGRLGCRNRLPRGAPGLVADAHPWGFCSANCQGRVMYEAFIEGSLPCPEVLRSTPHGANPFRGVSSAASAAAAAAGYGPHVH